MYIYILVVGDIALNIFSRHLFLAICNIKRSIQVQWNPKQSILYPITGCVIIIIVTCADMIWPDKFYVHSTIVCLYV